MLEGSGIIDFCFYVLLLYTAVVLVLNYAFNLLILIFGVSNGNKLCVLKSNIYCRVKVGTTKLCSLPLSGLTLASFARRLLKIDCCYRAYPG